jgi:REP element-mobilizing transposase RayT
VAEILDLLKHSVLKDLKVLFAESGNKSIFAIQHCCVQDNHVHMNANDIRGVREALSANRGLRESKTRREDEAESGYCTAEM